MHITEDCKTIYLSLRRPELQRRHSRRPDLQLRQRRDVRLRRRDASVRRQKRRRRQRDRRGRLESLSLETLRQLDDGLGWNPGPSTESQA